MLDEISNEFFNVGVVLIAGVSPRLIWQYASVAADSDVFPGFVNAHIALEPDLGFLDVLVTVIVQDCDNLAAVFVTGKFHTVLLMSFSWNRDSMKGSKEEPR